MRNALVVVTVAVVCFAAGRFSNQLPANADGWGVGGQALPPCKDVNGDGKVNVADPVYLLRWLFVGGPEPECSTETLHPRCMLATFGRDCRTSENPMLDCLGITCSEWDDPLATCPPGDRFVDNGDGTVTDTWAGLMWQKDTADTNGNGVLDFNDDQLSWCEAIRYCDGLVLAGHDDWRLPNALELMSIVDYSRPRSMAIDVAFTAPDQLDSRHWSSTTLGINVDAIRVLFLYGKVESFARHEPAYVRAVRTMQPGE